ncbi:hypothetical protein ITJ44_09900 [Clavibacter sp. VKM Ac-2873]|uniref:hypothetical protein n=1 Tax=Clavibacter sp. VKM Ac-2873 TaxID=2783813 RepID=UPI00188DC3D5|nr:hypothetical protein [Clavibacter sp. VKM Ac-2873]MBF4618385.1 hypothetical protein [Clavibacter sp. VKM Ac-2873]
MALLFLVQGRPSGAALGGGLAASYVVGELVGATWLGVLLRPRNFTAFLSVCLLLGGITALGLSLSGAALPIAWLIVLSFVTGIAPAAAPGAIQVYLLNSFAEEDAARALAAARIHGTLVWTAAPGLVAVAGVTASAGTPLMVSGLILVAGAVLVLLITTDRAPEAWRPRTRGGVGIGAGWPVYVTSALVMFLMALVELGLPALFEYRGIERLWLGATLGGFSLIGAAGALWYGRRGLPGGLRMQGSYLLLGMLVSVCSAAFAPGLVGMGAGVVAAGLFMSVLLLVRSLELKSIVAPEAQRAAFSLNYTASCAGYALSAAAAGWMFSIFRPDAVIGIAGAFVLVAFGGVVAVRSRSASRPADLPQADVV